MSYTVFACMVSQYINWSEGESGGDCVVGLVLSSHGRCCAGEADEELWVVQQAPFCSALFCTLGVLCK